jgi:hypothetical protein
MIMRRYDYARHLYHPNNASIIMVAPVVDLRHTCAGF